MDKKPDMFDYFQYNGNKAGDLMIKRDNYLNAIIPFIDTELIKVLTGVRRSGKSVMLKLIQEYLIGKDVKESQFITLNFEELRYKYNLDYHALNSFLGEEIAKNDEKSYIFLDEIQEVKDFEKVINFLLASHIDKVDIYITSSNAKFLSREFSTLLGRYVSFKIYPLTFSEYVEGKKRIDQERTNLEYFQAYLVEGGMPFFAFKDFSYQNRLSYLSDMFNSIILKDIYMKENLREPEILRRILNYGMLNSGKSFSANAIKNYLKEKSITASVTTILKYLESIKNAYIFIPLKRYDIEGKRFLSTQEKYYIVDHGLRQAVIGRNEQDIELVLENIVLLELIARGYEVFVGKTNQYEIDFVAEKKSQRGLDRIYVQVSYLIASEKTREREFRALREISDNYKKLLLSLDNFTSDSDGIVHKNIIDWLLDK